MKTIAAFSKAEDAHLLRARLEGNGIAAYVRDEYMVTLDWMYSNAIGGVKVEVSDEDYPAAVEFLTEEKAAFASEQPLAVAKPPRHAVARYLRLLSFLMACLFLLLLANGGVKTQADLVWALVTSCGLSVAITVVCALANL
ncbi:MAG: DUF2007 domain-containing protein [Verrucomicrobia bacterium]|nr:DUF2007 domain-containing protein [Verrucomicrobiota bacterium]